jgi:hypothetical protein
MLTKTYKAKQSYIWLQLSFQLLIFLLYKTKVLTQNNNISLAQNALVSCGSQGMMSN